MEEPIQDCLHRTLGYIEAKSEGDKVAMGYLRWILGYFNQAQNATADTSGLALWYMDKASGFLR